jgi:hypothetical protein
LSGFPARFVRPSDAASEFVSRSPHVDIGVSRRPKVLTLQIPKCAPEFAIAERAPATDEQFRKRRHERRPLRGLERSGYIENGVLLCIAEGNHVRPQRRRAACRPRKKISST